MDLDLLWNKLSTLNNQLALLSFSAPVTVVYNPLTYAWRPYRVYLERFARYKAPTVLLGMNPGPWGMAQTGIPFGEVHLVRNWLGIHEAIDQPETVHPMRPVLGFACQRREVSGKRLWGWAQWRFRKPEHFFKHFFVANYCPLIFMSELGTNITPDKLPRQEKEPLQALCDEALRQLLLYLKPKRVIGVGHYAKSRACAALKSLPLDIAGITHPSPANPRANSNWAGLIEQELSDLGLYLPRNVV